MTEFVDLDWPEEYLEYRRHVRSWLATSLEGKTFPALRTRKTIAPLLAWERNLYEAGYSGMDWPVEFGGRGIDPIRTAIFHEEYAQSSAPIRLNRQASGILAPTLMHAGSAEQQERWLKPILTCEDIWCQGFSEPDAGSDLASLRTRADRHGDHYVVNGQKVWSSNGPIADWTFALVRTDQNAPKHKGITYLLIDLRTPGCEVRPISQVSGYSEFAEIFFYDVEVPVANRVGPENAGWQVAMASLSFERGRSRYSGSFFQAILDDARRLIKRSGLGCDPAMVIEFTRLQADVRQYEINYLAMLTSGNTSSTAALEATHKLVWSEMQMRLYELGMEALGSDYELGSVAISDTVADWHERYWLARAALIYAGTNEIQRNIIAERQIGLPREPRWL